MDLRPLRLNERFNPVRLRREVEIMRRLNHPFIIKFIEVFEDHDSLMMVMEYCPGVELFDEILNRKAFTEHDAKPIFYQIASSLFYLHSLNIIHRDIKPENVILMRSKEEGHSPVAKLLDFGLSKNTGAQGSVGKTFVGTPCYLAPEVEYTSRGMGGTYSFPADCWSLGAVLYVMLVARFPEFELDRATGKVVVKLSAELWSDKSADAKDLIRSLMNTNPTARLTAGGALQHPWLGLFRQSVEQLAATAASTYDMSHQLQVEEDSLDDVVEEQQMLRNRGAMQHHTREESTWPGTVAAATGDASAVEQRVVVVRRRNDHGSSNNTNNSGANKVIGGDRTTPAIHVDRHAVGATGVGSSSQELIQLGPLLHLQR